MNIRKPYKNIPVGFSDSVTHTDIGPIYDLYFVTHKNEDNSYSRDERHYAIGRIGRNDDLGFGPNTYYATPIQYSPFTNTARRFGTRKEAAIYLLGVYEASKNWMSDMRSNPNPGNIGMRHMY